MAINWQQQAPIKPSQVIGQLPTAPSGGGDGGIGEIFSGLAGLAGGLSGKSSGGLSNNNPINQGASYGASQVGNALGTPQFNQPINTNLQNTIEQSDVFKNAMSQMGVKEGAPALSAYLGKANPKLDPTVTPWCAGYVNSVLQNSGRQGTGSLAAKSYLNYGEPVKTPSQGDIVVLNRTNNPALGHVGFVESINQQNGTVNVLGGNQDNSVSIKAYPMSKVAGFRRPPSGQQVKEFAIQNKVGSPEGLTALSQRLAGQQPQQQNIQQPQQSNPYVKDMNQTTGLIAKFENFSPNTYWDVNAHRTGYGSDTITKADGTVIPVRKGMTVTKEDALRDLNRRTPEFARTASRQVGEDRWNSLSPNAQAALTSVAYNYGSLPKRIIPAVKSGDPQMIAQAIRGLGGDNKGINKNRRNQEAEFILRPSTPQGPFPGASGNQAVRPQIGPQSLNDYQSLVPPNVQQQLPVAPLQQPQRMPNEGQGITQGKQQNMAQGINWGLLQNILRERGQG